MAKFIEQRVAWFLLYLASANVVAASPVAVASVAAPTSTGRPAAPPASDPNAPPASAAEAGVPMTLPTPTAVPTTAKPSNNHGYVLAQGTINQPYGANPYRTLTVTVSPCDNGYSPYIAMSIGGIAGWANHTAAEGWAVPTSMIKRSGDAYLVNYRAESRFFNGNWAWSSNVFVSWTLTCIPTDSFTYTPH